MMKQAFRSYLASLHSGNLKKLRESAVYLWTYMVLLFVYGSVALVQDNGYGDLACSFVLRVLFPLALMFWSDLGSKYLMPKAMFLCPMKEEERKEYIKCVLVVKIGAMVLSSFCVELIWSIFYGFRFWEILLVPFLFFLFGIAQYAGCGVKRDEKGQIPNHVEDKYGNKIPVWMNAMLMICVFVALVFITGYDLEILEMGNTKDAFVVLVFGGTSLAFAVLFAYLIAKRQFKYTIQQSGDYEFQFDIKGKVESPKKYDLFAK
jgi:hypothetical protein